ncbi:MAG: TQO small subunit DoxD [Candidatus Thorarchaeota archaeon]
MELNRNQWIAIILLVIVNVILGTIIALTLGPQWLVTHPELLFPSLNLALSPLIFIAILLVPTFFFLRWGWPDKIPLLSFLIPLRIALGYEFLHGGLEKILNPTYATNFGLLTLAASSAPSPYIQGFFTSVILLNPTFFLLLIAWGELLIGLSLTLGLFSRIGSFGGILMQWTFLFLLGWLSISTFGVNFLGSIAFFGVGMYQAGRYLGIDQWIGPKLEESKNAILRFLGLWT